MTIPTGHYDSKVRGRSKSRPRTWDADSNDGSREEDEGNDAPSALAGPRDRYPKGPSRAGARDEADPYGKASKSPPLSVTSRMRRCSLQSTTTEPTTASSHHTSFTSLPSEDPRLMYHHHNHHPPTHYEKKSTRRREPEPVQELVPSYDELYG
ncbi:hypothetical protein EYZ11_000798 [Aspergillus tanneri]|nr:hypothetical protein EYZ11_000798 [Aspergillus tanneri]